MRKRLTVEQEAPGYQLFMLALCLFALGALAAQMVFRVDPQSAVILACADNAICLLFALDFMLSLKRAPEKWRYLRTWGWVDLASSIPMVSAFRWGRLARVARIFRVLRGVRAAKMAAQLVLRHRAENTFLAATLVAFLLITVASISVLQFEAGAQPNITTAEDAIWWAFATITTVGYGDSYPVTTEGRFVAIILMSAGVALFGTFSGFLASWFLQTERSEIEGLKQELRALRETIERRP